jgi:flagellar protein FliT
MNLTLLDYYKAIESTSTQMLCAAEAEDWDEVVRLEGACAVLIEQLRERSKSMDLTVEERAEKHRIMLAILRHDAQMRSLAEPWLDDLGTTLYPRPSMQLH